MLELKNQYYIVHNLTEDDYYFCQKNIQVSEGAIMMYQPVFCKTCYVEDAGFNGFQFARDYGVRLTNTKILSLNDCEMTGIDKKEDLPEWPFEDKESAKMKAEMAFEKHERDNFLPRRIHNWIKKIFKRGK